MVESSRQDVAEPIPSPVAAARAANPAPDADPVGNEPAENQISMAVEGNPLPTDADPEDLPLSAVAILEERLSALETAPAAGISDDPFGAPGFRDAGLDDLEGLDGTSVSDTTRIETVAEGPVPDGYPPIPMRKPL